MRQLNGWHRRTTGTEETKEMRNVNTKMTHNCGKKTTNKHHNWTCENRPSLHITFQASLLSAPKYPENALCPQGQSQGLTMGAKAETDCKQMIDIHQLTWKKKKTATFRFNVVMTLNKLTCTTKEENSYLVLARVLQGQHQSAMTAHAKNVHQQIHDRWNTTNSCESLC